MSDLEFLMWVWEQIVYLAGWLWGEILYWINWLSADSKPLIASIIISAFALIMTYRMYRLNRKQTLLLERQQQIEQDRLDQEIQERRKRDLEISIFETKVFGGDYEDPIRRLGVWLAVSNLSLEQLLLKRVSVTLRFRKEYWFIDDNLIVSFLNKIKEKFNKYSISFFLYHRTHSATHTYIRFIEDSTEINFAEEIPLNFSLANSDTKEPIYFRPEKPYRFPDPNKKEIWFLHGTFTENDGMQLAQANFQLNGIEIRFETDQGMKSAEKEIYRFESSKDILGNDKPNEWSDYSFDFEILS